MITDQDKAQLAQLITAANDSSSAASILQGILGANDDDRRDVAIAALRLGANPDIVITGLLQANYELTPFTEKLGFAASTPPGMAVTAAIVLAVGALVWSRSRHKAS